MARLLLFVALVLSTIAASPTGGASAQLYGQECKSYDILCQEEAEEACEPWDYSCKKEAEDCPYWKTGCSSTGTTSSTNIRSSQPKAISYTESVTCYLVLKESLGGISGYCDSAGSADLDHCLTEGSSFSDPYTVEFLCSDGRPDFMAKPHRNEVSVRNLGSGHFFGNPYWILCDEGMGSLTSNKRCYDSDYSDGDDWEVGCKEDRRISKVYKYPDTYVWYVCR